jgi:hypothetical protein
MGLKNSQETGYIERQCVGVLNIGHAPESQHSCGFQGFLRDDY